MTRRKRHNPVKRLQRHQGASAAPYAIAWCGGIAEPVLIDLVRGQVAPAISRNEADSITKGRHRWSIHCAVLLRTQTGEDYLQSIMVRPEHPRNHAELVEACNEHHQALIKDTNPQHFVNAGWIACCNGSELADEAVADILTQLGAWEPVAKWQADQLEKVA